MSRIGKTPISVPSGVDVAVDDGNVTVKGPGGTLSRPIPGAITLRQDGDTLLVERPDDERENRALHGLTRTLVANMVQGVTGGFTKELEIVGVGYRAEAQGPARCGSPSATATLSSSRLPTASPSRCPCRRGSW